MALYELDEFQGPKFLGYVRAVPEPEGFSGQRWLPNETVDDLAFEYIKGVRNKPVMAHVMGFDSEAPIEGRPGLGERVQGELPPIKRKAKFGEKELIRFLQPRANSADKQSSINSVYNVTDRLLAGIQARVEWLRLKALSENTVVYNEGGIIFEFDYGLNDLFQVNLPAQTNGAGTDIATLVGPAWSDIANNTPLADLLYLCNLMGAATGTRPVEFVTSTLAAGYLQQSASLRTMIRGASAPTAILTMEEINALFQMYRLPVISTYDVLVTKENADGTTTDERTLAEDRGFLVPGTPVGKTLWGPTAESRRLIGTPLQSQAPGIIAVTYATEEPPAEWVKAAAVVFPTMPDAHLLGQIELF